LENSFESLFNRGGSRRASYRTVRAGLRRFDGNHEALADSIPQAQLHDVVVSLDDESLTETLANA
jgi:hypothetical protein